MSKAEEYDESRPGADICDQAYNALDNDDFIEAERLLKVVLSDYDLLPEWRLRMDIGYCQLETDRLPEARKNLEFAYKKINPSEMGEVFVGVSTLLARIYLKLNKHRKALKYLNGANKYVHLLTSPGWIFPKYEYYRNKGAAYSHLGRFSESAESHNEAVRIAQSEFPDDKNMLFYSLICQASAYLDLKNTEKARTILNSIKDSELDYHDPHEFYNVMIRYFDMLQPPDNQNVIEQYEILMKIGIKDDNKPEVFNSAARAYYHLGDLKKAKELFIESGKYPTDIKWMRKNNQAYLKLLKGE